MTTAVVTYQNQKVSNELKSHVKFILSFNGIEVQDVEDTGANRIAFYLPDYDTYLDVRYIGSIHHHAQKVFNIDPLSKVYYPVEHIKANAQRESNTGDPVWVCINFYVPKEGVHKLRFFLNAQLKTILTQLKFISPIGDTDMIHFDCESGLTLEEFIEALN